ncbi:hypothetical protein AB0I28_09335 [Phytomonospora sp. NPDC050363]|uniref:hypothetical protein n=1 Tax=Phytomonospora sp. NPDC050363 TaxID=3155642 RepID=UPI0033F73510
MRIKTTLLPALLALGLGLSACGSGEGGDGIASAGGDGAEPSSSAALTNEEAALRFAECMREQGIDVPDPDPDEDGFRMRLPEGVDPEAAKAATEVCKEFMPHGGEPPALNPEDLEKLRRFSQCMRDNGIEEFPDPSGDGGGIQADEGAFDPESPEFKAAEETCAAYRPEGPVNGGVVTD